MKTINIKIKNINNKPNNENDCKETSILDNLKKYSALISIIITVVSTFAVVLAKAFVRIYNVSKYKELHVNLDFFKDYSISNSIDSVLFYLIVVMLSMFLYILNFLCAKILKKFFEVKNKLNNNSNKKTGKKETVILEIFTHLLIVITNFLVFKNNFENVVPLVAFVTILTYFETIISYGISIFIYPDSTDLKAEKDISFNKEYDKVSNNTNKAVSTFFVSVLLLLVFIAIFAFFVIFGKSSYVLQDQRIITDEDGVQFVVLASTEYTYLVSPICKIGKNTIYIHNNNQTKISSLNVSYEVKNYDVALETNNENLCICSQKSETKENTDCCKNQNCQMKTA